MNNYESQKRIILSALKDGRIDPQSNINCFWGHIFNHYPNWMLIKSVLPERSNEIREILQTEYTRDQICVIQDALELKYLSDGLSAATYRALSMLKDLPQNKLQAVMAA